MLAEAGEPRETDSALQGLMEAMAGLQVGRDNRSRAPKHSTEDFHHLNSILTNVTQCISVAISVYLIVYHGLTKEQQVELQRLQALTESLQARAIRPKTPIISNNVVIQGEEQSEAQQAATSSPLPPATAGAGLPRGGNGRSLREDLG